MKSFYIKLSSIILIACLGVLVYSNTFHSSFHFDDDLYIVNNFSIRHIQDLPNIGKFYPCRFITFLSLAFNYHFNQLNVFGYHLFNIAVHLGSALLVWWLVLLTLSTPAMKGDKITQHANLVALLAGLVFVSHPVQTEAVTYIWQRTASMATLFYLASLCFYVKSRCTDGSGGQLAGGREGRPYYVLSLIAAIMAMFTKEMTITLPLMILLYEVGFLKTKKGLNWKHLIPFLLTLFIIPLTVILLPKSVRIREMEGVLSGFNTTSPMHYLLTQLRVMATYIRLLFLPLHQNVDYDYPISQSLFELPTLISFLFLVIVFFAAKRLWAKYRLVSFSVFWYFLALLPESSVTPLKDVIFEHRLYLPLVGYSMFLVSGLYYVLGKNMIKTMVIALTLIVACNSVLTYQRNKIWKNEFTLWDDTVQKAPHKARTYNARGLSYCKQGNFIQAISDYNKAIELDPAYERPYCNRGFIYSKQNNLTQAMSDFTKAIEINPNYAEAYNNRGNVYDKLNNPTQAMSDFTKAIEINPNYTEAYNNRGIIDSRQNNFTQAMSDYNKAIEINPNYAEAYNNRGTAYGQQGKITQAISDFTKAIELDPKSAEAYDNRGLTYDKQGNSTHAILDYNRAIEINSGYAQAYYDRGLAYFKQSNFTQAMSDFTKAIELNPKYAETYNNRGAIYDNQGNLTKAISDYNKAIELNPKLVQAHYNRGYDYGRLGNLTQAMSDYTKAIELDPDYIEAHVNRAIIYAQKNNFTQAMLDFNKAIEINPRYGPAYDNRAISYYQLKQYDKAWADVQKEEGLGYTVNPGLINALKKATGQDQ